MPGPPIYRNRPRPINPLDNPSTTGLAVNPNGTYIANPYPTTAAIGGTGAYGSGLPQLQVRPQLPLDKFFSDVGQGIKDWWSGRNTGRPPGVGGPMGPGPDVLRRAQGLPQTQVRYTPSPMVAPGSFAESQARRYNVPTVTDYQDAAARGGPISPLFQDKIIASIAADPQAYVNLSPSQKEAIERILTGGANATPGGSQALRQGDFYGYERDPQTGRSVRVVKNAANGDNFLNELRWDPQRKKYVKIGKLMKEGKLDKKGGWHKKGKGVKGRRRGEAKAAPSAPPAVQETTSGFTGSYGVVSFNTGTG